MERQTVNLGKNEPFLVFEGESISFKRRCMGVSCLILSIGLTFGLGFYGGYLMNDCDGSL
jgi:hypothetical protein